MDDPSSTAPLGRPSGPGALALSRASLKRWMKGRPRTGVSVTRARPLIQQVNDDATPVEITSKACSAVLMSLTAEEALRETAYPMRSPVNAQRLHDADAAPRAGRGVSQELDRA